MESVKHCWCGSDHLEKFSDEYLRCEVCGSLISNVGLEVEQIVVLNDEEDFYGKQYWFSHQTEDLGFPNIFQRSRSDLPERCLHWLRTLLKYKQPPASLLEMGCAHGGFVALAKWAGFNATGLELSPWIVEYAHKTFDIPMLTGLIEDQPIPKGSLDAIAMFDVMEHLSDPIATMSFCASLLKDDGVFIIQMPNYEGQAYQELVEKNDLFLMQLKAIEHLYLFNKTSAQEFFERLGFKHIAFERAIFPYDMFVVVSRQPLVSYNAEQISTSLTSQPFSRLVQALIDKEDELTAQGEPIAKLRKAYETSEADRAERLEVIRKQAEAVEQLQAQVIKLNEDLAKLIEVYQISENDRAARLNVINHQSNKIKRLEERFEQMRSNFRETKAALSHAQGLIEGMESSKFWKARNVWFKVKRKLGLKVKD